MIIRDVICDISIFTYKDFAVLMVNILVLQNGTITVFKKCMFKISITLLIIFSIKLQF